MQFWNEFRALGSGFLLYAGQIYTSILRALTQFCLFALIKHHRSTRHVSIHHHHFTVNYDQQWASHHLSRRACRTRLNAGHSQPWTWQSGPKVRLETAIDTGTSWKGRKPPSHATGIFWALHTRKHRRLQALENNRNRITDQGIN